MGCDKRYGLREIWVAPEASPNTPATFEGDNYLQHCTGSNFPAVYRENLDNAEATGNRGQSTPFSGAQNELAWDVTIMTPDSAAWGNPASLPESLQALLWAAGFGKQSGQVIMAVAAGSACGRTIQLIGLDRDKRQLELLTGAVVSQVVFTFSRTDVCTIQFSGTAAQKFQSVAPIIDPAYDLESTTLTARNRSSYDASLPTSPAVLTGVALTLPDASAELASIDYSEITLKTDFSGSTITAPTQAFWSIDRPASDPYDVLSPDSWRGGGFSSVQSATITMETGQGYGELTTAAQYPTEILSGQVKISANVTAYLVDNNSGRTGFDTGSQFSIGLLPVGGRSINIENAKLSEIPAFDLSNVDTPASGDFSLVGGEINSFISYGFLDTLFVN